MNKPLDNNMPDAEQQLHFAQFAMDNASDEIYWVSSDARIHYANKKASLALGYSREELLQLSIPDLDPLFPIEHWNEHWESLKRDKTQCFETQQRRKNGEVFPIEVVANYVKFGDLEYNVAYTRDITERKLKENALKKSEEEFRLLYETIPDGVIFQDILGHITRANSMAESILGLSLAQMQGTSAIDPRWHVIHEDGSNFPSDTHPAMSALRTGTQVRNVIMGIFNPGTESYRWIQVSATPQFKPGATTPYQVFTTLSDITERKQTEFKLHDSERRLSTLLDSTKIHLWAFDGTNYTYTNKQWFDYTGQTPDQLLTIERWVSVVHPDDLKSSGDIWLANWEAKTEHDNYFRLLRHDGVYRDFYCHAIPIFDENKVFQYFQGFNLDITERKQMEDQIRQLAFYDTLTNLPNRRLLNDRLTHALAQSKRSGKYSALLVLDLDNFKPLNDKFGHAIGDLLLIEVAQRLKTCVREVDTVARFGGDEFAVILSDLEQDKFDAITLTRKVADKILTSLSEPYEMTIPDGIATQRVNHRCSASLGATLFTDLRHPPEVLLRLADDAMYQAKASGRNRVCFSA